MEEPVNRLQQNFLEFLTKELIYSQSRSEIYKLCFRLRFDPRYEKLENKKIAVQVKKAMGNGFELDTFNPNLSKVNDLLTNNLGERMTADGVILPDPKKGPPPRGKSPWELIYKWLWEKEFPRRGWQLALDVAIDKGIKLYKVKQLEQQALFGDSRDLDLDPLPNIPENVIQIGEKYRLLLDFQQDGYLLLINQGTTGVKYGICPSVAFRRNGKLSTKEAIKVPDDMEAMVNYLKYKDVGTEKFLAILTDEPLSLSWVNSSSNPKDITICDERLSEIFQQLYQKSTCQVFSAIYQVIAPG